MKVVEGRRLNSSHDCYDECLRFKTSGLNLIPDTAFIERDIFEKSPLEIATIRDIENREKLNILLKDEQNGNEKGFLQKYQQLHSQWLEFEELCSQKCDRSDCTYRQTIPLLYYMDKGEKNDNETLKEVRVFMRLTNSPVLEINYVPKHRFIDFFVYISGGLSFWLGVSGVLITDLVVNAVRWMIDKDLRGKTTVEEHNDSYPEADRGNSPPKMGRMSSTPEVTRRRRRKRPFEHSNYGNTNYSSYPGYPDYKTTHNGWNAENIQRNPFPSVREIGGMSNWGNHNRHPTLEPERRSDWRTGAKFSPTHFGSQTRGNADERLLQGANEAPRLEDLLLNMRRY